MTSKSLFIVAFRVTESISRHVFYKQLSYHTLHKASPTFLRKTRSNRLQLLRRRKAVLKIIEDFQKNIGGGVRF